MTREVASAPDAPKEMRTMLTFEQVLRRVPVSPTTLKLMERQGRFPKGCFVSGNRKIWFEDEIAEWQHSLSTAGAKTHSRRKRKR